jgi:hypothetical protein
MNITDWDIVDSLGHISWDVLRKGKLYRMSGMVTSISMAGSINDAEPPIATIKFYVMENKTIPSDVPVDDALPDVSRYFRPLDI